jgi:hypothetical protein
VGMGVPTRVCRDDLAEDVLSRAVEPEGGIDTATPNGKALYS